MKPSLTEMMNSRIPAKIPAEAKDSNLVLANKDVQISVAVDLAEPESAIVCFDAPVVWLKFNYDDVQRLIEQLLTARQSMRRLT